MFNKLDKFFKFIFDLLPFQSGQALKPHIQYCPGLYIGQPETSHQPVPGVIRGSGFPDQLYDSIQVVKGNQQSFKNMGPFLSLGKFEPGTADDNLMPVVHVMHDQVLEI